MMNPVPRCFFHDLFAVAAADGGFWLRFNFDIPVEFGASARISLLWVTPSFWTALFFLVSIAECGALPVFPTCSTFLLRSPQRSAYSHGGRLCRVGSDSAVGIGHAPALLAIAMG